MAFAEARRGIAARVYDGDEDRTVADAAGCFGTCGGGHGIEVLGGGEARVRATMTSMVVGRSEVYILVLESRQERL